MANLLKGKAVADAITLSNIEKVNTLKEKGITPTLAIFRVGENESDLSYERGALKRCESTGVNVKQFVFDLEVDEETFYRSLDEANNDNNIHGILVFRPLPKRFDDNKLRNFINPLKDVDGCSDASLGSLFIGTDLGYAPCTARAVMEILDHYKIDVNSKNVCVVGRSLVIGKPVSMLLLNRNATVDICHSRTKNLYKHTKKADVVIAAAGQMEMLNKEYFKKGQTVIDVGIHFNEEKGKLTGDVLFEDAEPVAKNITPVPGGVGSVTTSVLVKHVISAAEKSADR